jgi:hypothetical protein
MKDDDDIQDYVRPWVELTMDDFTDILKLASEGRPLEIWELFKAVEAKVREKNT